MLDTNAESNTESDLDLEARIAQEAARLGIEANRDEIFNYLHGLAASLTNGDVSIIAAVRGRPKADIIEENEARKVRPRAKLIDIDTAADPRYEIRDQGWFEQRFFRVRNYFGKARVCYFTCSQHPKTGQKTREFVAKSHSEFLDTYIDNKKAAVQFLTRTKNVYEKIVCKPDELVGANEINIWNGFSVEPREGDISMYRHFVEDVICDGDKTLFEYLYNLMAYGVQRPFEKFNVYLLLYSDTEGTGKDTFVDFYGMLFVDYYTTSNPDRILGRFNEQIAWAPFVKLEDNVFPEKDMPKLRATISGGKLDIEGKGVKGGNVDNMLKFAQTTNKLPEGISPTDRRTLPVPVSKKRVGDKHYWDTLHVWYRKMGGASAVLDFLLKRDISNFKPYPRPVTRLLKAIQDKGLKDHELAFREMLVDGEFPVFATAKPVKVNDKWSNPPKYIDMRMSTTEFRTRYQDRYPGLRGISDNKLADLFKTHGAEKCKEMKGNKWQFLDLKQTQKKWDEYRNSEEGWEIFDWWNGEVTDATQEKKRSEEASQGKPSESECNVISIKDRTGSDF